MKSVLQDWVMELGLRHQGVLVNACRGCDSAPKNDPSKLLTRSFRAIVLNAHCGNPDKAATYIQRVPHEELLRRMAAFLKNLDHYPHHYVMHLIHAAEIVGYKCRTDEQFGFWIDFYFRACKGLHVNPETEEQLDARLNADEETFAKADSASAFTPHNLSGPARVGGQKGPAKIAEGDARYGPDAGRDTDRPGYHSVDRADTRAAYPDPRTGSAGGHGLRPLD